MIKLKKQIWAWLALVMLCGLGFVQPVMAADTTPQSQQAATRTFNSDAYIQKGTIVTLKKGDPNKVVSATAETLNQMLGVTVSANDSAITLTDADGRDKTFVATSGRYNVLVTDQGGPIKPGDYITVSSVDGTGMKTGTTQGLVLGTAASSFAGKDDSLTTAELKNSDGTASQVHLGMVQVDINIGQNPFLYHSNGGVPKTLNNLTQTLAGRQVSAARIYSSLALFVIIIVVSASIIFSGIRGSFAAIGRNPLARRSILRGLVQVIVTALVIFTFGLLGVYLILKL